MENAYYLLVSADSKPGEAYREGVRFHWNRFARPLLSQTAADQTGTDPRYRSLQDWDDWREVVWLKEARKQWLTIPLPDGSVGGGVLTRRWTPQSSDYCKKPSVYLTSWFNSLRTSYAMALYARRTGQKELLELAGQTVNLALKTPGREGAFKCVAFPDGDDASVIWLAGDGQLWSTRDGFLGFDMCWTAYWLLQWREAKLPGSDDILERCRGLANFLIRRQMANGMLPTHFNEDGSVQEDTSRTVMAETGPAALFLLELYKHEPDSHYLAAAKKGLSFLEKEVICNRKWFDYETFWSCCRREPKLDESTGQWPVNTLALSHAVAAYLAAYEITHEPRYLEIGEKLLDYLLLYQQCWTNPALDGLSSKTMLLGGFTVQNADSEWSDARQSQFGNLLLDYYLATAKTEYLERGVAALRAQFPVSPAENWAHRNYKRAGVSSFHWGTGSGMAGIEIEDAYLRDAVVDVAAARGIGVNGINITACSVKDNEIRLELCAGFESSREPVVTFKQVKESEQYKLVVNGRELGKFKGTTLADGIPLPRIPRDYSGPWIKYPEPVLSPGAPGDWDGNQLQSPCVIKVKDTYYMYYLGQNKHGGTYSTGLGTSKDLLHWKKHPANPILDAKKGMWDEGYAADAEVIQDGDIYRMYYVRDRIGYAESKDAVHWEKVNLNLFEYQGSKENNICLDQGPAGAWDHEALADPQVVKVGDLYHMYYCGLDDPLTKGGSWKIGHATSTDGVHWEKDLNNPVLSPGPKREWDAWWIAGNQVIHRDGQYIMFYNAFADQKSCIFRIGLATSTDGSHWTKHPKNPILDCGPVGSWQGKGVAQPGIFENEQGTFLFFMGTGDAKHAGHDYIGVARLGVASKLGLQQVQPTD